VIGHSRFSGPAAHEVREERFPEAQLVHIVHMVTEALGRVQGRPAKGIENQEIEKGLVAGADLAVGVGPALFEEVQRLAEMSGSEPAFHEMIPGVPFEEPQPPPVGERTPNVLLFGRADDSQKGTLEAAVMIRELLKDMNVRLTVRGAQPETLEEAKERLSRAAGREVEVRPFTVDRAEILADLREADVVIMPSRAEGFGLVGLEAAGAGVPILVPSSSGIGRFVGDPSLFPAEVAQQSVVEQEFEEVVPVERWVEKLREVLGDLPTARERALELRRLLQETNRTWKGAAESLIAAVRALPRRDPPVPPVSEGPFPPEEDE
jgi:glycosyltransferase involved in cell wall biosynthesis